VSIVNSALPFGFQTRYISFSNASAAFAINPMPWWSGTFPLNLIGHGIPWNTSQPLLPFSRMVVSDVETTTGYFGAQVVIHTSAGQTLGPQLYSNLQYEYR